MRNPSLKKRFWKQAGIAPDGDGFVILLDQHMLGTPGGSTLRLPTRRLAKAVAEEWRAQAERVEPATMPLSRRANSAIDKVTPQFDEVAGMLARYGESDLLCYRAGHPVGLAQRQSAAWDPLVDWAKRRWRAELVTTNGVMPVPQAPECTENLAAPIRRMTPFQLTGFHDLVVISGSLVIALAVIGDHAEPGDLFELSHLDETWQEEQWGTDPEAEESRSRKKREFLDAARFYWLSGEESAGPIPTK